MTSVPLLETPVVDLSPLHQGGFRVPRRATYYLVVHHAASHYRQATGPEDVAAIANWHIHGRGWSGVGYHEVLAEETNGGPVVAYVVSDPELQRAHIALQNDVAFGICCATDFRNTIPDQKWIDALADRLYTHRRRWPGARIVGHGEQARPGYETTCPGTRWPAWKPRLLAAVALRDLATAPPPQPPIVTTINSPILGPATGTPESAVAYLSARARSTQYDRADVAHIVNAYQREGRAVGVDWFLALAQMAHETGALTSFWSARPQRNPAGLGVTGERSDTCPTEGAWARNPATGVWERGLSFDRWDPDAVRAHLGRLLAYALPAGEGTPEQQAMIDEALALRPLPARYRGIAPTLAGLGGTWAYPGQGYAARVAARANAMRGEG